MIIGFVPSSQFGGGSVWVYVGIVGGGLLLLGVVIPWLCLRLRKPSWRLAGADVPDAEATGEVA